jgi:hypothetical protein
VSAGSRCAERSHANGDFVIEQLDSRGLYQHLDGKNASFEKLFVETTLDRVGYTGKIELRIVQAAVSEQGV